MKKKALKALDRLYTLGYEVLKDTTQEEMHVEGMFVSDSGILVVKNCRISKLRCLRLLLEVVKKINIGMLKDNFMLTTSIAYGHFKYEGRIEFQGIEKNLIYGEAYVSAFLDNETGRPRIQPGQCRIVLKNLPQEVRGELDHHNPNDEILRFIKKELMIMLTTISTGWYVT